MAKFNFHDGYEHLLGIPRERRIKDSCLFALSPSKDVLQCYSTQL